MRRTLHHPFPLHRHGAVGGLTLVVLLFTYLVTCAALAAAQPAVIFLPLAVSRPPLAAIPAGGGFDEVTAVTHAGDGRLFVLERAGRIKILQPDGRINLFLDITNRVISSPGEYGAYDLAFHPGYNDPASPGFGLFYLTYTGRDLGSVRYFVSRFHRSADPDVADPDSEAWLLRDEQTYSWHKGGELDFDLTSGYLYVGLGDDRQPLEAQNNRSVKGKIVRLAVDEVDAGIVGNATSLIDEEIWAYGLRNPWRFDIDPTGDRILVGDVGEHLWEEINLIPLRIRDTNFGWPCMEGPEGDPVFAGYAECENTTRFRLPISYYPHAAGRCAIIGGKVYRPAADPGDGRFVYGDLCSREIFTLSPAGSQWQSTRLGVLDIPGLLTTIGEDKNGNLYVGTTALSAPIFRLVFE